MATCCQQLKTKVLSKVGTCDLNQVSVQLSRMDGIHWVELSENDELFSKIPAHFTTPSMKTEDMTEEGFLAHQELRKQQFTQAANMLIKQLFSFHACLQLEFELMPTAV
jgi:hypothetical protein